MKNILVFSPFYKSHIGGLESFVEDFNNELIKRSDIKITLVTSLIPNGQKEIEIGNNLKIIRLPFFELIHNFPVPMFWKYKFWKGYQNLFKDNYVVVVSHTRFFLTSLMAYFFSKRKRIQWVHFEHGSDFVQTNNFLVRFFSRVYDYSFGKFVLLKADKLISISEAVSDFVNSLSKRKSTVLYRGFDFSKILSVSVNKSIEKKYEGFVKIIFVGRLISGKGVDDLLTSLETISTKKKWVCFVVGDGNCMSDLTKHSKKANLNGRIIFTGKMNHRDTLGMIKACDLFVNPSYTEGLPTVVIEAAVLKRPVIATNVGGTNECFYKKIPMFKPGDIDTMANKIDSFLNVNKLDYSIIENYDYVINKFNWKKTIDSFLSLI